VPQCVQQKFKFCGVLNEDVEGLDYSFRRARKIATISFVTSVCLSDRICIILTFVYFRKYVEKIQVSLKSDTYSGYLESCECGNEPSGSVKCREFLD